MSPHRFTARLFAWDDDSPGSWVFLALPPEVSDLVDEQATEGGRGFGSVRVQVLVGSTEWETSLFPSKQRGTYVLPVKKAVRRAEGVAPGDEVRVSLRVVG